MKKDLQVFDSGFSTPGLDRALAVLECLSGEPLGLTQTEIASRLGLTANFVYRTTQALVSHGYLRRHSDRRLRLSNRLLNLCQPVVDDIPLTEAALPALHWLSDETGEAAHLGILDGVQGLVLERVIGHAMVKFYVERGTRFPLHTSAPGKCLLAFLPGSKRDPVLKLMKFERFHPWTISSRKQFHQCLDGVRECGWAIDAGEHLEGHHCLGAPILNAEGEAVASLWITGPSQRLSEERMNELASTVVRAGEMASQTLNRGFVAAAE